MVWLVLLSLCATLTTYEKCSSLFGSSVCWTIKRLTQNLSELKLLLLSAATLADKRPPVSRYLFPRLLASVLKAPSLCIYALIKAEIWLFHVELFSFKSNVLKQKILQTKISSCIWSNPAFAYRPAVSEHESSHEH